MKRIIIIAFVLMGFTVNAQVDRSKMPEAGPAPKIELGEIQSFTMDNGMKVFVVENHKLPRVTYSMVLDIDPFTEGDKVGMADLAGDLISKGTNSKTKDELNFEVDFIGASFGTSATSMFGRSLTKHQNKLLEIMSDVAMNPAMKQEELDKLKKQYISGIQTEKDDPDAISRNVRRVLLYGKDHPYGEITTEESLENVTLEDVNNYYQTYWRPNVAYMAVVGDVKMKEVKSMLEKYFGKWEKKEVPTHEYEMPKQSEGMQIAFVNKPGAVQSVITVANTIDLKPGGEDAVASAVTNGILGGGFVSKLNLNLREAHSYTYGARSSISSDELVGNFNASAKVRNEVTDSALVEMMKEINAMRDGSVTEDELNTIKNYRTGIFAYSLENPQTKANFAINIQRYNMPEDYYATYLKRLSEVGLDDVKSISQKYIQPDKGFMLVVGNQEEVAEKVKALSPNGKISFYDSYGNPAEETSMKAVSGDVTAESVVNNYIEAVGGKEAIEGIKTVKMVYGAEMGGQKMEMKVVSQSPDKYLQEMSMGGGAMIVQKQVVNGDKGKQSGMQGAKDLSEEEVKDLLEEMNPIPEINFLGEDYELELKGIDKKNDQDVYVLKIMKSNGDEQTNYYSTETGLLVSSVKMVDTPQGKMPDETGFGDYKDVNGVKIPHNIIVSAGPRKLTFVLTEAEVNGKLDKGLFSLD